MTIDKDGLAPCPFCGVQYEQKPSAWPMDEPYAEHPRVGSPLDGHCILSGHMFALLPALVESWNRRALPNTGDELVGKVERQAEVIKGQAAKLRRLRSELRRRYGDIAWHRDPLNRASNFYQRLYDARKARALKELR